MNDTEQSGTRGNGAERLEEIKKKETWDWDAGDVVWLIGEVERLRGEDEIWRKNHRRQLQRAEKAEAELQNLTPGGSEFQLVEECVRWIRDRLSTRAKQAIENRRLQERVRELERDISILRGLSQKERIYRGSFAQYATETVETSDVTKRALTSHTEQGEGMTIKEKEADKLLKENE